MKFDIETYREILDTLSKNKSRSLLTGFGIFWGVFMLVALMGGGKGLQHMLSDNFKGFATNSAMMWAQPTTKAYHGFKKGRTWNMTLTDVKRLDENIPELQVVTPNINIVGRVAVLGDRSKTVTLNGVFTDYVKVEAPELKEGRYINEIDIKEARKVCVIGKGVYEELFPEGGNPCGQRIRIDSVYYNVVGLDISTSKHGGENRVFLPFTLAQKQYNYGENVDQIHVTSVPGVRMDELEDRMRSIIARAHDIHPNDEKGVMVFNTEVLFGLMDNMFKGVDILIWLVGLGTLLAGIIGVSNIMMVTVKERTSEIGIRRAIGATPRDILMQIILESMILTAVAGMLGIMFSVFVLQMADAGAAKGGEIYFQVSFETAFAAAALLGILGVVAGIAPAYRAMNIKPVEAMREED